MKRLLMAGPLLAATTGAALMFGGIGIGHAAPVTYTCPFGTYLNRATNMCECGYGHWEPGLQQCNSGPLPGDPNWHAP